MKTIFLLLLLFVLSTSPLLARETGEDILSFMLNTREELEEEYFSWIASRIIYETSRKYSRSVVDVLHLYQELFSYPDEIPTDQEGWLQELGFEKRNNHWYYAEEPVLAEGRLFTASEVAKAYREIYFGDSEAEVRKKLKEDLGYQGEVLMPVISIAGAPFIMNFSFYQDQLYQLLITHKETRFADDTFRFWDGINHQEILYQVIYSQYGEPSSFRELTLSSMEPPYDGRVAWSSTWGPEKTGGEKEIRTGINYVSFKGTLCITYLPLLAEKEGYPLITKEKESPPDESVDERIQDAGKDF